MHTLFFANAIVYYFPVYNYTRVLEFCKFNDEIDIFIFRRRITFVLINLCVLFGVDGFAFSQEEGGSVSQTDVIRAYDTNKPKPEGM